MNRRNFLRIGATTTAAITLGLSACATKDKFVPAKVPEADRVKIGVIGLGDRGSAILDVLKNVPEFKVVAICDIFDFRFSKAKERIANKVRTYKDFNEMLDNSELEAVVISTPLFEHYRMVMAALDKDIHILCEKALAYNIEQCVDIKTKAAQSSKLFQISYQYQLNPMFQAIKELIHKGYCGRITRVEGTWDRNGSWRRKLPDLKDVPELSSKEELERIINWRLYDEYSGGLNAELGSHQYNMIENILGTHPKKVIGTGGIDYWKDGRETFDNVHMLFDHPNGVKVGFHSGTSNAYEGYQLKFYGDKATIITHAMDTATIYPEEKSQNEAWRDEVDSVTGASIKIIDNDKRKTINPKISDDIVYPTDNFYYNTTWLLYKNFYKAIKGKEKLILGLDEGYQSAISVHIANLAVRNAEVAEWKMDYNI